jgi:hypothetical protein
MRSQRIVCLFYVFTIDDVFLSKQTHSPKNIKSNTKTLQYSFHHT